MEKANPRVVLIRNLEQARRELARIGADSGGVGVMAAKSVFLPVKLTGIGIKQAIILKQEMLSRGGEAAVHRAVGNLSCEETDVLLLGTLRQHLDLCKKLRSQPFGLGRLAQEIEEVVKTAATGYRKWHWRWQGRELVLGERTLVMGILNVTPDSFSDGGKFNELTAAVKQAKAMVAAGADIIDVGGESTRPGHTPVDAEEEMARVLPVIKALVEEIDVPISVDTYKARVAEAAIQAGASIINDVWGLRADRDMARVVAETGVPYIMMHNQQGTEYRDLMGDVLAFFREGIDWLTAAGANLDLLALDPGIGFGKTYEHNLEVLARLDELRTLNYPILLGTSRKSVIGNTLGLPVNERVEGTGATVALGIAMGAEIVRVHDVEAMIRVARMTDAIVRRCW
ncbi:dihydropteroate synthase [Carboxydocella sporoproducens DSM 16521]|uniref:Dihydropteroate synthase n=2 Tax=Carboxydocella TaxID=178898 RepID=A0A1T4RKK5_9FIRM|nr:MULTISPECIES: dihydropteroate synthase [Carboxydocella]AVX19307.1 Dihydropteroate synthase [Carboxydocella thermautotrophica]AVX29721.1 Dihydropteroate synthase [Carboxydocella thermautotrophica]SKA16512.1 dihydropteroate synthase [Carboxydocella sporoproducens DSM 16521]